MLLFCKVGGIILVTVRLSGTRWHTKHQTNIKQPTNNPCQMLAVRRCQAKSPAAALSSGSGVSPRGWHHLAPGSWQLATLRCISVSQGIPRDPKGSQGIPGSNCLGVPWAMRTEFGQSLPIKINISCVWQYNQGHNDPHSIQSLPAQPCHEQSDPHLRQPADILPNPDRIWKKKRGDRSWTNMSKLVQLNAYWHLQLDTERNALSPLQHTATTDPFWWCSLHTPSGRNVCTMPEQRSSGASKQRANATKRPTIPGANVCIYVVIDRQNGEHGDALWATWAWTFDAYVPTNSQPS